MIGKVRVTTREGPKTWTDRVKETFDGNCVGCLSVRPRCASVHFRVAGKASLYEQASHPLCDQCRRSPHYKGTFRLNASHK